jgi:predicted amidohydrolase YtcJ
MLVLSGCGTPAPTQSGLRTSVADAIYQGGDIVTMEGDAPQYVEAVAIRDGTIIYLGDNGGADALAGAATRRIDLKDRTMLPGFIDAHGHVWNAGLQALSANLLPPPDGEGRDIATLIRLATEWAARNEDAIAKAGWVIGVGYDDAQLKEQRHPTADDLDRISTTTPVIFLHQSGHLGAMNHKGLETAGYTAASNDPPGGVIRRGAGGRTPDGVLEEMALFAPWFSMMGELDEQTNVAIAKAGMKAYASQGFTTAQEGRATKATTETWRGLADRGELMLDVDVYPDIQAEEAYVRSVRVSSDYANGFRVAGVKLSLDGSPQGRTAWLTQPYKVPPPAQTAGYRGYPAFPNDADVQRLIDTAYENRWQLLVHANGDAAADQMINAVRQSVSKYGKGDRRTVMIHAQTVREDQLDAMKELAIIPSFFGMHTYYWGDWHRDVTLGQERAFRISPTQSALHRGMIFTEHHDAPVALPSAMAILSATVNRISRSGEVIGPDQRVSAYDALRSLTAWAAYQGVQENRTGSLKVGKLADFVILDRNPLKVDAQTVGTLKVMETIKRGSPIYTAGIDR